MAFSPSARRKACRASYSAPYLGIDGCPNGREHCPDKDQQRRYETLYASLVHVPTGPFANGCGVGISLRRDAQPRHVRSGPDKMGVMQGEDEPRKPVKPPGALPDEGTVAHSKPGDWPDPAGALGTTVDSWAEPALEANATTAPEIVPRPERPGLLLRVGRGLPLMLGCIGLLTASFMEGNLTTNSWVNLPTGIAIGILSVGLLLVRRAWARSLRQRGPEVSEVWERRADRRRQIRLALGCLLLAGSVVAATVPVPPQDPVFLSTRAACGSAVLTRSLIAERSSPPLKTPEAQFDEIVGAAAYDSDCVPARQSEQSGAIVLALVGSLMLAFAIQRRQRTTTGVGPVGLASPEKEQPPHGLSARWPWRSAAILAAAVALLGGLLTIRTRDDMASATAYDRKEVVWVTAYGRQITPMIETMNAVLLPHILHHDLPGILAGCQKALDQSVALEGVTANVPAFLPSEVKPDAKAFLDHARRALENCVVASKARNYPLLRRSSAPQFTDAGNVFSRLEKILAPR